MFKKIDKMQQYRIYNLFQYPYKSMTYQSIETHNSHKDPSYSPPPSDSMPHGGKPRLRVIEMPSQIFAVKLFVTHLLLNKLPVKSNYVFF